MGTWGPGNFDSDDALDFLAREVRRHIDGIEGILADEEEFHLDEAAEGVLIPHVAILGLLCEHCQAHLPDTVDVQRWKALYLAMYDQEIGGLEPEPGGFEQQRRATIEATFDRLASSGQR